MIYFEAGGTVIVLGAFPEYLEEASRRGANAFAPSARVWRAFADTGGQWTMCRSYLNANRHVHQEFLLATNPAAISEASTTMLELKYMLHHGFRLDSNGTRLVAVK
jgi:hypothetical protein